MVLPPFWLSYRSCFFKAPESRSCWSLWFCGTCPTRSATAAAQMALEGLGLFFFPKNKLVLNMFNLKVGFMAPKIRFGRLGLGCFLVLHAQPGVSWVLPTQSRYMGSLVPNGDSHLHLFG